MRICIIVDMQRDFIDGALGTPEAQAIIPYVENETHNSRYGYDMFFFTRDEHFLGDKRTVEAERVLTHCLAGTIGASVWPSLINESATYRFVDKRTFGLTYLPDYLMDEACGYGEDIDEIHIMGVCTDICVISNVLILRAAFPSVRIFVHANGCAGTSPAAHQAALTVMRNCCIDVI